MIIAGFTWLAGILSSFFVSMVAFVATWIGRRLALVALAVVAFTALSGAFVLTMEGLLSGLVTAFPITANIGFVLPDGYASSVSVYLAGRIAWWVYSMNWLIIRMRLM